VPRLSARKATTGEPLLVQKRCQQYGTRCSTSEEGLTKNYLVQKKNLGEGNDKRLRAHALPAPTPDDRRLGEPRSSMGSRKYGWPSGG